MSAPLGFNDSISEEGFWWLPNNPGNRLAGTLTYNPDDGALLNLNGLYAFANEPSLMQRLRAVLKIIEDDFSMIPPGFAGNFARSVVDTRNYNTHFSVELEAKALDEAGMHWASRRIILLLSILFLRRIGIPAGAIQKVLSRHQEFQRLWSVAGQPF